MSAFHMWGQGELNDGSQGDWKPSVKFATTAALAAHTRSGNVLTASGNGAFPATDGYTPVLDDTFLSKDEAASHLEHGIYQIIQLGDGSNPWKSQRVDWMDDAADFTPNCWVPVEQGTVNGDKNFVLTTNGTIVVNTTAIAFVDSTLLLSLVTAAAKGTVNALGAANTVLTTDGATAGGAWALVVDANVSATAAIAGTKISPNFGSQAVTTTGLGTFGSLAGSAGTGALSFGSYTGDTTLPTGAVSWTGAASKAVSLIAAAAAITITAAAASVWKTTVSTLTVDAATLLNLGVTDATSVAIGRAGQAVDLKGHTTVDANQDLSGAAGTGRVLFGSMTGVSTMPTGNMTWTGASGSNLNLTAAGVGTVTIESATGTINIGASVGARTVNIATGAAVQTINVGTGAAANVVTIGATNTTAALTLQTGTGAFTQTAGGAWDVNAVGAATLDSSGGAISIGADANAQAINVGTGAAARTITIGNATGATSVVLNAGTGNIDVGTGAFARTVNLATGAAVQTVTLGSDNGASTMTIQTGTVPIKFRVAAVEQVNINTQAANWFSGGVASLLTGLAARDFAIESSTTGRLLLQSGANQTIALSAGSLVFYNSSVQLGMTLTPGNTPSIVFPTTATTSTIEALGAGVLAIQSTTGALNLNVTANIRTTNLCTGNAVQTVNIANHATPVNIINIGGAASTLGFFGATAVVKQTSGANLTNNVTAGGTDDTIANYTDLTTYATDAAAIRNDIYQLSRKLKQINDGLRLFGLLT